MLVGVVEWVSVDKRFTQYYSIAEEQSYIKSGEGAGK